MKEKTYDINKDCRACPVAVFYPVLYWVDSDALDSGEKKECGGSFGCGIFDYATFMLAGDGSMYFVCKIL